MPVWRIRIDTACNLLALEARDPDLLLAHFYTLATDTFILRKLDLNPSKAWWQGLEDAQYGQVYLHGYGDRKTGQHKGIIAYNAIAANQQWVQEELAFYGMAQEGLLGYNADKPEEPLSILSPTSGETISTGISQQQAAQFTADYTLERYEACVFPVQYREGEPYFEEVRSFILEQHGAKPINTIEYAETSDCIVVSYYTQGANGELDNFVGVYDLGGNMLLKVKLGSGLSGVGSDTFFIFNLRLYLLVDKQKLQVYSL